jgi:hypothetical protein
VSCRPASSLRSAPDDRNGFVGFRVAAFMECSAAIPSISCLDNPLEPDVTDFEVSVLDFEDDDTG